MHSTALSYPVVVVTWLRHAMVRVGNNCHVTVIVIKYELNITQGGGQFHISFMMIDR